MGVGSVGGRLGGGKGGGEDVGLSWIKLDYLATKLARIVDKKVS